MNACKIYKKRFCTPFSGIPVKVMNLRNDGKSAKIPGDFAQNLFFTSETKFFLTLEAMFDETNEFATPK